MKLIVYLILFLLLFSSIRAVFIFWKKGVLDFFTNREENEFGLSDISVWLLSIGFMIFFIIKLSMFLLKNISS